MKLFDLLIKANTVVMAGAVLVTLAGSPFFSKEVPVKMGAAEEEEEVSAVVAGAFDRAVLPTATPTPSPTPTPIPVSAPVRIEIPALQISTDVVHVGVTEANVMEVPDDFLKVGWYDKSPMPGEKRGNATIMSGHFDTSQGLPAVFYSLETLKPGDDVIITTELGIQYVFGVINTFSHPLEDFPSDIVYGEVDGSYLKLITCDGVWHADKGSYSDRLVVTTKLKKIVLPARAPEAT